MNDAAPQTETSTATQTLAIGGLTFVAPAPYAEGHQLSVAEANVLNQVFAENLRNNYRAKVQAAIDEAAKAGTKLEGEPLEKLMAEFATYAENYEFAGKRQSRGPVDPVQREAEKLAKDKILEALRKKNIDKKSLAEGQFENMVKDLLAKRPEFLEVARKRVEEAQSLAADLLD